MGKVFQIQSKSYSGRLSNGLPFGYGQMNYESVGFKDELIYKGNWYRGRFQGKGMIKFDNMEFIGEFKQGMMTGEFTINGKGDFIGSLTILREILREIDQNLYDAKKLENQINKVKFAA